MSGFEWAIKNGDLEQVKNCIDKDKSQVNKETENGRCPLHYAADYNQVKILEFLILKDADINKKDKYGITPLLAAIYEGHRDSVILLLKKGADKTLKAPDGSSYIECAETQEIKDLLK